MNQKEFMIIFKEGGSYLNDFYTQAKKLFDQGLKELEKRKKFLRRQ